MAGTVRIGLIGCGNHGRNNLSPGLVATKEAELVACSDPDEAAAYKAVQDFGYGRAYSDYPEMLSNENLDGVIVAARNDQLSEIALDVIAAGHDIFLEKPAALNKKGAEEVRDAARDAGIKVMVDYSLRFAESRLFMKDLLDRGAVGDVMHVCAGKGSGWILKGWKADLSKGGGDLLHHSVHVIDQILWMLNNRPERVYSEIIWHPETGADHYSAFTVRFKNGVIAESVGAQGVGGGMDFLEVMGSAGRVRAEYPSGKVQVYSEALPEYSHPTTFQPKSDLTMEMYHDATRAWVDSLLENREPPVTLDDAVNVLEIIDAVFESGRTGMPVSLS